MPPAEAHLPKSLPFIRPVGTAEGRAERRTVRGAARSTALSLLRVLDRVVQARPRRFCLVTGAPRSGTTAVAKWLHGHLSIVAFRESRVLIALHRFLEEAARFRHTGTPEELATLARALAYRYYRGQRLLLGRRLLVDKEPLEPIAIRDGRYGAFVGSVRMLFPEGRLLFMLRGPYATIWSMRRRKWGYSLTGTEPQSFSLDEHIDNWCACTELALRYADDPRAYLCSFERLVAEPEAESRHIFAFLGLRGGPSFQPHPVKEVGFSDEERARIRARTQPLVDALRERGIADL